MNSLQKYFNLTQKIKELNKMRDQIKDELLQDIDGELIQGNFKAKVCERAYGFDQKRFKEERPKIYSKYYREDTYEYLLVTQINKSKAA